MARGWGEALLDLPGPDTLGRGGSPLLPGNTANLAVKKTNVASYSFICVSFLSNVGQRSQHTHTPLALIISCI